MTIVKEGQKVCISFEAKLETGEVVLKTEDEKPLEIVPGAGTIPASIEKAVIDMKEGDTKTITLEPQEAFGQKMDELIIEVPSESFGENKPAEIGSKVQMNSPEGKQFVGVVLAINDEKIKIDFNHPLAGQKLIFSITVISIK